MIAHAHPKREIGTTNKIKWKKLIDWIAKLIVDAGSPCTRPVNHWIKTLTLLLRVVAILFCTVQSINQKCRSQEHLELHGDFLRACYCRRLLHWTLVMIPVPALGRRKQTPRSTSLVALTLSILTLTLFTIVCARNVAFLRNTGVFMAQISTPAIKRLTLSVPVSESS